MKVQWCSPAVFAAIVMISFGIVSCGAGARAGDALLAEQNEATADALIANGSLSLARDALEDARRVRQRHLAADPHHPTEARDLSALDLKLGDLLRRVGDAPAAAAAYREAIDLRRGLVRQAASRLSERDLSVALVRFGEVAADATSARAAFTEAIAIRTRGLADTPDDARAQRDLAVAHQKFADRLSSFGDAVGAREAYAAAAALDAAPQAVAGADAARDRAVLALKRGDVYLAETNTQAALAAYREAHAGFVGSARDQSVADIKIGDALLMDGDLAGAQRHYTAALDARAALAGQQAESADALRDLSLAHEKLGDAARAAGEPERATAAYRAAGVALDQLREAAPSNPAWAREAGLVQTKLGDALKALRQVSEAQCAYEAARGLLSGPGAALDLAKVQGRIALLLADAGDLPGAADALTAGRAAATREGETAEARRVVAWLDRQSWRVDQRSKNAERLVISPKSQ